MSLIATAIVILLCVCAGLVYVLRGGVMYYVVAVLCCAALTPLAARALALDLGLWLPPWYLMFGVSLVASAGMYRRRCDGIDTAFRRVAARRVARSTWQSESVRWKVETVD